MSIGASALRNQGGKVIGPTREYLAEEVSLDELREALQDEQAFKQFLKGHTTRLKRKYKLIEEPGWGAARKALNLFLRDVCYNAALAHALGLPRSEKAWTERLQWLEVPLDGQVARELRKWNKWLPAWTGIRKLDPTVSRRYQASALRLADELGTARVHLDIALWRREGKGLV